jgi:hypothetical protein
MNESEIIRVKGADGVWRILTITPKIFKGVQHIVIGTGRWGNAIGNFVTHIALNPSEARRLQIALKRLM